MEYALSINFTADNFDQSIIKDYCCKNELLGCSVLPYEAGGAVNMGRYLRET
jgi:hypothetical protein